MLIILYISLIFINTIDFKVNLSQLFYFSTLKAIHIYLYWIILKFYNFDIYPFSAIILAQFFFFFLVNEVQYVGHLAYQTPSSFVLILKFPCYKVLLWSLISFSQVTSMNKEIIPVSDRNLTRITQVFAPHGFTYITNKYTKRKSWPILF